jgi:hypothetical protein
MFRNRTVVSWLLAGAGAVAFMVGASAEPVVSPVFAGDGTSDNPFWAGSPAVSAEQGRGGGGQGRGGGNQQPQRPRPYDEVITAEAQTDDGVFKVHRIGEELFYEIPTAVCFG